jgi:hypothetical protein
LIAAGASKAYFAATADLLQKAMRLAHVLKLKTLHLLHIAYALHLAERRHTPSPLWTEKSPRDET